MKKFFINILKFAAFVIPFYIIGLCIWSWIMPPFLAKNVRSNIAAYGHFFSRSRDAENIKNPDILFLGSSHAYRGFDTRMFSQANISSFNLGSSSQSPINTQVLLKQYLQKIKPKLVVYEVCAGTLSIDGVESSLDILSNGKIDKNALDMTLKLNNILSYNTLFYGYFRQVFNLNKNLKEPAKQNEDFYIKGGGFVETTYIQYNPEHLKKTKGEISPSQIDALKENIKILKDNKTPYILIQAPVTQTLYNSKTNNKEVDDLLKKLGPYKNFQNEIVLDDKKDFYDNNHMNQEAVVKFNLKFIEYLKTQNIKF